MGVFKIKGGNPISGEINIQGSKNAVLPILAAAIMTDEECVIKNCPVLRDVDKTILVLRGLGCSVRREGGVITVRTDGFCDCEICSTLMREMRSSIIFLGAILTRCKKAVVSMPGGCPIGLRPIDLHIKALKRLGVKITEEHGYIGCTAEKLVGCDIHLDFPSVGATENIMLSAVTAKGSTIITNAAREPEICDLANFLNAMGAKISGAGGSVIRIDGVQKLHGTEYSIIPDRIVAATYLGAAAITGGELTIRKINRSHMDAMLTTLADMGAELKTEADAVKLLPMKKIHSVNMIRTMPYPGFPTDIQSPFAAVLTRAEGTSIIVENIFENRFRCVDELVRMGADIKVNSRTAVIRGVPRLYGARVSACELRGGAALVLAALSAEGESVVENTEYIDRGYERMEEKLSLCGGNIIRADK